MLRKIRIGLSVLMLALTTFYFLDFAGLLPESFSLVARIQLVPALLLGRIYCSVICPMGIFQDVINWLSKKMPGKKKRFRYTPAKNILRWSVVAVVVIAFFCGFTMLLGLIEPYSAFGRMVTNVFRPLYMVGNNLLESVMSKFDNYTFYQVDASLTSLSAFFIGLVTLAVIGYLAWRHGRTCAPSVRCLDSSAVFHC